MQEKHWEELNEKKGMKWYDMEDGKKYRETTKGGEGRDKTTERSNGSLKDRVVGAVKGG